MRGIVAVRVGLGCGDGCWVEVDGAGSDGICCRGGEKDHLSLRGVRVGLGGVRGVVCKLFCGLPSGGTKVGCTASGDGKVGEWGL